VREEETRLVLRGKKEGYSRKPKPLGRKGETLGARIMTADIGRAEVKEISRNKGTKKGGKKCLRKGKGGHIGNCGGENKKGRGMRGGCVAGE